jgi:hypothetical protein
MTIALMLFSIGLTPAFGQAPSETVLREFFEGKRVVAKLDMPATADGVDLTVDRRPAINFDDYGKRVKKSGIAIRAGESVIITKIKVKDKLIEFQLGGGGYGTFGDETTATAYATPVEKSKREQALERDLKREDDPDRRRNMERELDRLRRERHNEDQRNRLAAEAAAEAKRIRIQEARLRAGSRFNIRYSNGVPSEVSAADIMNSLAEYVDFSSQVDASGGTVSSPGVEHSDTVSPVGQLRKGMTIEQAETQLGSPVEESERMEGTFRVRTAIFVRADQRIKAEFVEGVLVRYSITSQ